MSKQKSAPGGPELHCNEVRLVGRLSGQPVERILPSGDVLLSWRLVVGRDPDEVASGRPSVDTLDCATFRGGCRRSVSGWATGDVVEVSGALRRRFWRTPAGAASRVEVEVRSAHRLTRAPVSAARPTARGATGRSAVSA